MNMLRTHILINCKLFIILVLHLKHKIISFEIEYLARNNTNIIIVDWGKLSKLPCYPGAVFNTRQAGECVGNFLLKLAPLFKDESDFTKIHMVGFSLGAHVVSFASNIVRKSMGVKFERITGTLLFQFYEFLFLMAIEFGNESAALGGRKQINEMLFGMAL